MRARPTHLVCLGNRVTGRFQHPPACGAADKCRAGIGNRAGRRQSVRVATSALTLVVGVAFLCFAGQQRPAAAAAPHGLLRLLGVGFGVAVIVGSTLGVGILRTPGLVAAQVPSTANIFLVWIVGGIYTLLASVCLTELGSMLPEAGGYYAYARRAFGDTVGFAVGWTDWLTYCAVLGYVSIAMGEFTVLLVPSLAGATKVVAVVMLLGFTGLQLAGVRVSSRFQQVTTAVKFVAFLLLVGACLAHALTAGAPADVEASALAAPGFSGLVGGSGWVQATTFATISAPDTTTWTTSTVGPVNELDEALPEVDRVTAVAYWMLCRRMARRGPKPQQQEWQAEEKLAAAEAAPFVEWQNEAPSPYTGPRVPLHPNGKAWRPAVFAGRRWP